MKKIIAFQENNIMNSLSSFVRDSPLLIGDTDHADNSIQNDFVCMIKTLHKIQPYNKTLFVEFLPQGLTINNVEDIPRVKTETIQLWKLDSKKSSRILPLFDIYAELFNFGIEKIVGIDFVERHNNPQLWCDYRKVSEANSIWQNHINEVLGTNQIGNDYIVFFGAGHLETFGQYCYRDGVGYEDACQSNGLEQLFPNTKIISLNGYGLVSGWDCGSHKDRIMGLNNKLIIDLLEALK